MNNIAENYNKGKNLLKESLTIQEKYYSTRNHIHIALVLKWIAISDINLGNYSEGKKL